MLEKLELDKPGMAAKRRKEGSSQFSRIKQQPETRERRRRFKEEDEEETAGPLSFAHTLWSLVSVCYLAYLDLFW